MCSVLGAAGGKAKGNTGPDVTAIDLIFQVGFVSNAWDIRPEVARTELAHKDVRLRRNAPDRGYFISDSRAA
ncbi:hypothetical protein [Bradyrhizobium sp. NAS96.2]|uniref:hypothetical protein n=1 Tax=Bradyrhizobium sp. NAS96.2 TaxID=1680160 RepID=UPI0011612233|nr:hypothetical protein [Bradyrhizobium sp. NAS96.2]